MPAVWSFDLLHNMASTTIGPPGCTAVYRLKTNANALAVSQPGIEVNCRFLSFPESSCSCRSMRDWNQEMGGGYKSNIAILQSFGNNVLHRVVKEMPKRRRYLVSEPSLELILYRRDLSYRKSCSNFRAGLLVTLIRAVGIATDASPHESDINGWFDVEDPRSREPPWRGRLFDVNQAWEVARMDLLYCDWKARQDVRAIKTLHDKVVDVLNPMARDWKSVQTLRNELADLQQDLSKAHEQVHLSEARISIALQKLEEMEALVNDKLLEDTPSAQSKQGQETVQLQDTVSQQNANSPTRLQRRNRMALHKSLNVSGPVQAYSPGLKEYWYPVAFSADIKEDIMVPFDCFEEPWVLFRGKDGRVGCVQNSCAHRSCPLHLGAVKDGHIQCPYHGWEYSTTGVCKKMPSTKLVNVRIKALPCVEQDGMVWIWPGAKVPEASVPSLAPPTGFTVHAQIVIELPVEHGLLMENLLDLAHAPFTHTTTFAKGWTVPSLVKFCTPVTTLQGYWDPYPIDMEFQPPCMVRSTIGISNPGKLEGNSCSSCSKHLHQLHVCLPSSHRKTRLLYQMSLDFFPMLKFVPYIQILWRHLANKVLDEDLRLVLGQQDRMIRGANVWNMPVTYDKLGVRYRRWRLRVEAGDSAGSM